MAQLGDLVRAKALLRRAARAFGPKEAVARARCVVAEAEIALVSRDLGWPAKALDAARATLEEHGDRVERRACALSRGPAPPPDRAPRRGRAGARRARSRAVSARVENRSRAGRRGDRDAAPPDEGGARRARSRRARRARRTDPGAGGGGRKRSPRPEHARGAPDREWRGATRSCSTRSKRCWRRTRSSWTRAVMSCVTQARSSRSQRVRCCSRSRARWAKRGRATSRGTRSSRAHSDREFADESHRARLRVEVGRLRAALRTLAGVTATKRGFALVPRRAREVVVLARPVEEEHAAVLAFLADGESWSSSALALALGASQRTVQRALDSLAAAGKVQSFGRGRARRWMTPPVPGFTTTLLLPAPLPID